MSKKTNKEIQEQLEERCKNKDLTILNLSKVSAKYSTFKCNKCEKVFDTKVYYILTKDRGCPRCQPDWHPRRITTEYFADDVNYYLKNKYTVIGKYVNNKEKVLFRCNSCRNEFKMRPNDLLVNGHGCPECAKQRCREANLKGVEEYNKEINKLSNNKYSVIDYSDKDGYTIKHNSCEHEWTEKRLYSLKKRLENNNEPCPKCDNYIKKFTIPQLSKTISEVAKDEYEVQDDFTTVTEYCTVKHINVV